jgi:hypothetical protein
MNYLENDMKKKQLGALLVKVSIALIIIGFLMLVQPLTMVLYTYGFGVVLSGVVLFNIASHL